METRFGRLPVGEWFHVASEAVSACERYTRMSVRSKRGASEGGREADFG
jgi:hypothetical protein